MEQLKGDFNQYTSAFRLAQAHSRINWDSILIDALQWGVSNQLAIMMTTTALPLGQEKTGWRWEQWHDKAGEFYRNVVWLQEIRRRDDDIIPRRSPQEQKPFWKKKPTSDLDAMDIDRISLSPYEKGTIWRKTDASHVMRQDANCGNTKRGLLCLAQVGTSVDLKASWRVTREYFWGVQH